MCEKKEKRGTLCDRHSNSSLLQSTLTMVKASDVVLILVAIIFPPAAALVVTGCSCDLLINVLLTTYISTFLSCRFSTHLCGCCYSLGYLPGHIHAFWLIYKKMQAEERYGDGGFRCMCSISLFSLGIHGSLDFTDLGSGHYEPLYQSDPYPGQYSHSPMPVPQPYPQAPQHYGTTPQYR